MRYLVRFCKSERYRGRGLPSAIYDRNNRETNFNCINGERRSNKTRDGDYGKGTR